MMRTARQRWQQQRRSTGLPLPRLKTKDDTDASTSATAPHLELQSSQEDQVHKIGVCHRKRRLLWLRRSRIKMVAACIVLLLAILWMFGHLSLELEMQRLCPTNHQRPQKQRQQQVPSPPPQDICFVTCIFGDDISQVDQPANVEWYNHHWCHVQFLLVTNLPTLPAKGWNKIVQQQQQDIVPSSTTAASDKNYIVQSREAKFLGWKVLPNVQEQCAVVIYMDGYLQPQKRSSSWWWNLLVGRSTSTLTKFRHIADQVQHHHPWGLSQVKQAYFNGLPTTTILHNLVRDRKDTPEHVNATLTWLQQQQNDGDDFPEVMTYYLNKYFAYDPRNQKYQQLSTWFWQHYTTYRGLWRDQPLWAYTLHHFNVTPAVMTSQGVITRGGDLFEKGGILGWDQHIYV